MNTPEREIAELAEKLKPGMRVMIKKPHPWQGYSGVLREKFDSPVGAMWHVDLDNGMCAGASEWSLMP